MRTCRECGFPKKFNRYFDWRSDGTIISRDRTHTETEVTFLEAGEFERLLADLEDTIEMPVDRFLMEAERGIGKAIYDNTPIRFLKYVPANPCVRPQWLARLSVRIMRGDMAALGYGVVTSADSYRGGGSMVLRFRNPCMVPRVVGGSLGIYESIEKMDAAAVQYGIEENGDLVIRMSHSKTVEAPTGRLKLDKVVPGNGPIQYERCHRCGAPSMAARALSWDIGNGIITNRSTGRREVMLAVQTLNAMQRELEKELGEAVPQILFVAEKTITKDRLQVERHDVDSFWDDYLLSLAIRGLGYPTSFIDRDDTVIVTIDNSYNQTLYAAKLAAAFEVLTGRSSQVEWRERRPDHAVYEISPAPVWHG